MSVEEDLAMWDFPLVLERVRHFVDHLELANTFIHLGELLQAVVMKPTVRSIGFITPSLAAIPLSWRWISTKLGSRKAVDIAQSIAVGIESVPKTDAAPNTNVTPKARPVVYPDESNYMYRGIRGLYEKASMGGTIISVIQPFYSGNVVMPIDGSLESLAEVAVSKKLNIHYIFVGSQREIDALLPLQLENIHLRYEFAHVHWKALSRAAKKQFGFRAGQRQNVTFLPETGDVITQKRDRAGNHLSGCLHLSKSTRKRFASMASNLAIASGIWKFHRTDA